MSKRILKKLFLLITSCFLLTACGKSGQEAVNTYGFEKYSYRYARDYTEKTGVEIADASVAGRVGAIAHVIMPGPRGIQIKNAVLIPFVI